MPLEQHLEQTQKLILTQAMQQSLRCLQLPILELRAFLQDAALSNPLLDVEETPLDRLPHELVQERAEGMDDLPIERREQLIWDSGRPSDSGDFTAYLSRPQSFPSYLMAQLGQLPAIDGNMLALCQYLVGCLNSAGYLDIPLPELAAELRRPLFDMEQALFVVQTLEPTGVGARSLSECLLLQLAQGKEFTEINIHLVQKGLPFLAHNDISGLAALLHAQRQEVERAAQVVRSLNPIPSRGFGDGAQSSFILPEATIRSTHGQVVIEMNRQSMPRVSLNAGYCALLGSPECREAQLYLKEKIAEAKSLIANVQNRSDTLYRLLCAVVSNQQDYFLRGGPLVPMTMRDLASQLSLNASTVSRAVKEKYIQWDGHVLPLRSFFSASLPTSEGVSISAETARRQIRRFITAEDPLRPLSDAALCDALQGIGILLSRRTVAKYRGELGIPAASRRKGGGK